MAITVLSGWQTRNVAVASGVATYFVGVGTAPAGTTGLSTIAGSPDSTLRLHGVNYANLSNDPTFAGPNTVEAANAGDLTFDRAAYTVDFDVNDALLAGTELYYNVHWKEIQAYRGDFDGAANLPTAGNQVGAVAFDGNNYLQWNGTIWDNPQGNPNATNGYNNVIDHYANMRFNLISGNALTTIARTRQHILTSTDSSHVVAGTGNSGIDAYINGTAPVTMQAEPNVNLAIDQPLMFNPSASVQVSAGTQGVLTKLSETQVRYTRSGNEAVGDCNVFDIYWRDADGTVERGELGIKVVSNAQLEFDENLWNSQVSQGTPRVTAPGYVEDLKPFLTNEEIASGTLEAHSENNIDIDNVVVIDQTNKTVTVNKPSNTGTYNFTISVVMP